MLSGDHGDLQASSNLNDEDYKEAQWDQTG